MPMPMETKTNSALSRSLFRGFLLSAILAFVVALSPREADAQAQAPAYTLDSGDRLRITVFGHPDLSGEFEVGSSGAVSMPLIGDVQAEGLSLQSLEQAVIAKLKPDYLKNPQVSAEVVNYRPFFIIGEVRNPGTYAYIGGMRVVNAVALAGGFTYRARKDQIKVTRAKGDGQPETVGQDAIVLPGDVIQIPERFF